MAWEVDVQSARVADTDLATYRFYLDGVAAGDVSVGALNPIPFTYTIASDGTYSLTVSAIDLVGNESAQSAATVTNLDSIAPQVPGAPAIVAIRFI